MRGSRFRVGDTFLEQHLGRNVVRSAHGAVRQSPTVLLPVRLGV